MTSSAPPSVTDDAPTADAFVAPTTTNDVRAVSMPFIDRFASALVTGVPPVIFVIGMYFGWTGGLLNWQDLLIFAVCYAGIGMGITVGFHRLLTHRSFKCNRWVRATFAALGSVRAEGPVIDWVATHRKHHQFSDEEGDPHSPHAGHDHGFTRRVQGAACTPTSAGSSATWRSPTSSATPRICSPTR